MFVVVVVYIYFLIVVVVYISFHTVVVVVYTSCLIVAVFAVDAPTCRLVLQVTTTRIVNCPLYCRSSA